MKRHRDIMWENTTSFTDVIYKNRKYITYCKATRGGPSYNQRWHAQKFWQSSAGWWYFQAMRMNRQTSGQSQCFTSLPGRRRHNNSSSSSNEPDDVLVEYGRGWCRLGTRRRDEVLAGVAQRAKVTWPGRHAATVGIGRVRRIRVERSRLHTSVLQQRKRTRQTTPPPTRSAALPGPHWVSLTVHISARNM